MASAPQTLPDLIDKIGLGWAQARVAFLGGGVWMADGAELVLISAVAPAVASEWNLTALQKGITVSIVYWGTLVGNFMSGPIGDYMGRRLPIITSFSGIVIFSLASASTRSFLELCFARFFVGFAFGFGQPALQVMITEVTPTHGRALVSVASFSILTLGGMYSAGLILYDDPAMEHLRWRWLLGMGSIPAGVLLVLSALGLRESPFFLSAAGRHREAKEVLQSMAEDNGVADVVSVEFVAPKLEHASKGLTASVARHAGIIFSGQMWLSSLIVMYSCVVLNCINYGSLYAFPQIIGHVGLKGSPAFELMVGVLLTIPGLMMANVFCELLTRKVAIKTYSAGMTVFLALFSHFAVAKTSAVATFFVSVGYYGIKFFSSVGFVVVYLYITEIYPTEVRATGTALSIAVGRVAATLTPLVYEALTAASNFGAYFLLLAGMCFLNGLLIDLLPYETANKQISDVMLHNPDKDSSTYGAV